MAYKVEKVIDSVAILGEGPHWDEDTQSLLFVDVFEKAIRRYVPSTNFHAKAVIGEKTVSFAIPVEGQPNKFVIGYGNKLSLITWDGKSGEISGLETLVTVQDDSGLSYQFNDGKVDSSGRLWTGVWCPKSQSDFVPKKGSLYSLNDDRTLKRQVGNISLTNGLAWNDDIKRFYYIDTPEDAVFQFDYDDEKADISNQKTIFTFKQHGISGSPDGMTIDTDGNLWVAAVGASSVIKIDPRRPETLLQTVKLPALQVTSVAFGGPNLDELYVTSGCIAFGDKPAPEGSEHGATYKVTDLGVKGLPGNKVKL